MQLRQSLRQSLLCGAVICLIGTSSVFAQQPANGADPTDTGPIGGDTVGANADNTLQSTEFDAQEIGGDAVDIVEGGQFDNMENFFEDYSPQRRNGPARSSFGGARSTVTRIGGSPTTSRAVAPRFRIAFDPGNSLNPFSIRDALTSRIGRLAQNTRSLRSVQVQSIKNGRVVLSGQVGSAEDRRLAAALARIEPGVRSVSSNLTMPAAPASPLPAAPATDVPPLPKSPGSRSLLPRRSGTPVMPVVPGGVGLGSSRRPVIGIGPRR